MRLQGNVFRSFFACLLPLLPLRLLSFFVTAAPSATAFYIQLENIVFAFPRIGYLLPVFLIGLRVFVSNPMSVEMSRYFCKLMTTKDIKLNPLIVCNCFGKGYLTKTFSMLLTDLITIASYLLPLAIAFLIPGVVNVTLSDGLPVYTISSWIMPFMTIGSVSLIIMTIRLCMTKYYLVSEKNCTAFQALHSSITITRKRTWELFLLNLSFLPWSLLDTLTYIAGIYYYPYRYAVEASYYLGFSSSDEIISAEDSSDNESDEGPFS